MTKTTFMDKYPVHSFEIKKSETTFSCVDDIIKYFQTKVKAHPIATEIAIFDHFSHTTSLEGGEIAVGIKDAKNFLFCFGKQLPTTKILAVRPRSIGISELENSFVIDFLEVPNEQLHGVVAEWVKSVANKI